MALFGAAAALLVTGGVVVAQEGIGRNDPDGNYRTLSEGLKVIGGFDFSESCAYDPSRNVIVAPNMGNRTNAGFFNDGWVSLINHDGSVHTLQFIAGDDETGIWVNDPFGSDIVNGVLYMADRIGGTAEDDPLVAVVTMFDMATGEMLGMHEVPDSTGFNDLEVTDDGVIYASESSDPGRIFQVNPDGSFSVFLEGAPLARPNGVALDNDGNIVVVNIGDDAVLTFSTGGELLVTENAVEGGNDGLVIMEDGTKYVSSVRFGSISRIPPGGEAEMIAVGMPGGASMCYDPVGNQLVVPMNNANALVFVPLGM
jgi:hypothetical protein